MAIHVSPTRVGWLLVLVVLAAAPRAQAAPYSFTQFVADLRADPGRAAGYLGSCETLVTPGGEVRQPCTLTVADLGIPAGATLAVTKAHGGELPADASYEDALVVARVGKRVVATFRVLRVERMVMVDGDLDFRPVVVQWSRLISDAELRSRAVAGTLPTPPPIKASVATPAFGSDTDAEDWRVLVEGIGDVLRDGQDVREFADRLTRGTIVFRATDPRPLTGARGARTMKAWRLPLRVVGGAVVAGGLDGAWAVVQASARLSGTDRELRYTMLVVFTAGMTSGGGELVHAMPIISLGIAS